jgi:hypothetical protein
MLLRDGCFEGGGTAFWAEDENRERRSCQNPDLRSLDPEHAKDQSGGAYAPTVSVQPMAGVGVIFNGNMKHAGKVVSCGARHVLVASFSISNSAAK